MKPSLLLSALLLWTYLGFSQGTQVVKGTLTNAEDGSPLAGASVVAPKTTIGKFTDKDGNYSIALPDTVTSLIFSYAGFIQKQVKLEGRAILNIALEPNASTLSEVVIVGYGEQKEANLTGAIENVALEDVSARVLTDASQIIQGKIAGGPDCPELRAAR